MINWEKPLLLEGEKVQLIPMQKAHKDDLLSAATDGELWELWYTSVPSAASIDAYIETALQQHLNKQSIPFAVVDKATNTIIGATRYCNIDSLNKRLEIGYTWYAKSYQRTGINTECKYLLLQNAFENFETIAVELRTHWHNHKSRAAIARLGAKQDGVLRSHKITASGHLRDTVVFSIIASEWPTVKQSLAFEIKKHSRT